MPLDESNGSNGAAPRLPQPRPSIGWREWLALPQFGVAAIKAKIDTGARSSCVHAFDIKVIAGPDGGEWVQFSVHPFQRTTVGGLIVEAPVAAWRPIRSSNGSTELRPIIRTLFRLGTTAEPYEIDLSLSNRDTMGFRMLLGREALRGRFLVDPGRSYLFGRRSRYPSKQDRLAARRNKSK